MVKEKEKSEALELTIPVAGMTCAACVRKVEKVLKGLPGVQEATGSLPAGKAGGVVDPGLFSLPEAERAITDIGYEVPWSRLEMLVLGMMGTHCEEAIKTALGTVPGVVSVSVNLGTDTVAVEYSEALVSAAAIKKTIRGLGYQGSGKGEGEGALDRGRPAG